MPALLLLLRDLVPVFPALLPRDSLQLLPQIVTARLIAAARQQGLQPQSHRPPQRATRDVAARAGLGDRCMAALAAVRPG